ncbi:MAG: TIGR00730 family Rossman fold protein [Xanthobacteraceae bacterium]|nr:TIGR00730 family Rossman fold protein [Xanthobacteraceae bacterium]MBV9632764.1 TIGR00730 family Rossman fold protein [Xanthobacteraceae bacterium]
MSMIQSICVYCGSSPGNDPVFVETARKFGQILAQHGITLVYGGGSRGLMGALALSVHEHGGRVIGVIPEFLKVRERMFTGAEEIIVTRDMHERKRMMFERADAFVALPGGIGTLEELVEQLTWSQLGRHRKPILVANINGFWEPLVELLAHMKRSGFIHSDLMFDYAVVDRIEDVVPTIKSAAARVTEPAEPVPEAIERM